MAKYKQTKKSTVIICVAIIAVLAIGLIAAIILESHDRDNDSLDYDDADTVYFDSVEYKPKANLRTLLVVGVDKTGKTSEAIEYNNAGQCDFISLLVMDNANESYKVLQINRDAMANIPVLGITGEITDTVYAQLALSHAYGDGLKQSCKNVKTAVSDYLYGVNIDNYAVFNIDAVGIATDIVGGVEVTLNDDFSKFDKAMVKGKTLNLNSKQAIIFTRYRKDIGDNTNASRMTRQRDFLTAFLPKARAYFEADKEASAKFYDTVADYMVSSLNKSDFGGLAKKLYSYTFDGYVTINGESKMGEEFVEFYTDENDLKAKVIELFYKQA